MKRCFLRVLITLSAASGALPVSAQPPGIPFGTNEEAHLDRALHCLNMKREDLRFAKNHGEPEVVLKGIEHLLDQPLHLPALAEDCLRVVAGEDPQAAWGLVAQLLELPSETPVPMEMHWDTPMPWDWLNPLLAESITRFAQVAQWVDSRMTSAMAGLTDEEKQYLAASCLGSTFTIEDRPEVREAHYAVGVSTAVVDRVVAAGRELDPEPSARAFLDATMRLDRAAMLHAARVFHSAVARLYSVLVEFDAWPESRVRLYTPAGDLFIGTSGPDSYSAPALLILDPGGADSYSGEAGLANGLLGRRLSAVIDLEGDDDYAASGLLGPASALFGTAVLLDRTGNDSYRAAYSGLGSGLFGHAWLEDRAGDDTYQAYALAQGAGIVGSGLLFDVQGRDRYDVGLEGQAFAGFLGVGFLVDEQGSDLYYAGGREPDHERHNDRFLSLSQGMSIGMRPFAGGGYAVLVDLEGNDTYQADVYGQGVGYWYAVGMLLDMAGEDTYSMYHYGQGSGIHLSLGLLADGGGNDSYNGYILAQGSAHDYGVGMLLEGGGHDTYTADHHAQGRALNNGLALLLDRDGDDAYFARQPEQAQGVGNDGGRREYGSLALLLDLDGRDAYSCGAEDGARFLRPDFGIVYDAGDGTTDAHR